jgi:hypothetical protein
MKKKWIALAALLALILVSVSCVSLVVLWPIWRQRPEQLPAGPGANWVSDFIRDDPNKGRGHITIIGAAFEDGGELVWKTTFEVQGDPTRIQAGVARYKSQASGEGKITVTMISRTAPDPFGRAKDLIKDQDKRPVVWDVKRKADGTLEIRRPYSGAPLTFLFRKEN